MPTRFCCMSFIPITIEDGICWDLHVNSYSRVRIFTLQFEQKRISFENGYQTHLIAKQLSLLGSLGANTAEV